MGNEDMGGGLYCVMRAVSTNDIWSCSTAKSTYSPLSICCCSWVGTGTGSCWEVFCSGCSCCGCCRGCICRWLPLLWLYQWLSLLPSLASLAVVVPVEHGDTVGFEAEPWAV